MGTMTVRGRTAGSRRLFKRMINKRIFKYYCSNWEQYIIATLFHISRSQRYPTLIRVQLPFFWEEEEEGGRKVFLKLALKIRVPFSKPYLECIRSLACNLWYIIVMWYKSLVWIFPVYQRIIHSYSQYTLVKELYLKKKEFFYINVRLGSDSKQMWAVTSVKILKWHVIHYESQVYICYG